MPTHWRGVAGTQTCGAQRWSTLLCERHATTPASRPRCLAFCAHGACLAANKRRARAPTHLAGPHVHRPTDGLSRCGAGESARLGHALKKILQEENRLSTSGLMSRRRRRVLDTCPCRGPRARCRAHGAARCAAWSARSVERAVARRVVRRAWANPTWFPRPGWQRIGRLTMLPGCSARALLVMVWATAWEPRRTGPQRAIAPRASWVPVRRGASRSASRVVLGVGVFRSRRESFTDESSLRHFALSLGCRRMSSKERELSSVRTAHTVSAGWKNRVQM